MHVGVTFKKALRLDASARFPNLPQASNCAIPLRLTRRIGRSVGPQNGALFSIEKTSPCIIGVCEACGCIGASVFMLAVIIAAASAPESATVASRRVELVYRGRSLRGTRLPCSRR